VHYFPRGLKPSIHKEVALKNPNTLHEAIQATLRVEATETKNEVTQRSTSRLNVIEEDSDFSEAIEEVDSESEEDSHGATDGKPWELYEIRRLTQEEVDIFKQEGKCFICQKRGHIAIDCPDIKEKDILRKLRPKRPGKQDTSRQRAASCMVGFRLLQRLGMRTRQKKYETRYLIRH
jgi:hypothetical protein